MAGALVSVGAVLAADTGWRVQRSPNPDTIDNELFGVAATSRTNAWAVGQARGALVEHWDGKTWKVQKSFHGLFGTAAFNGVAATSSTNAWAVGYDLPHGLESTLVERWDGTAWKVQRSANRVNCHGCENVLSGVAATSPTNAWAVGNYDVKLHDKTLVEHWNGKAWSIQPSPNRGSKNGFDDLSGVAATSSTNAWAVGRYETNDGTLKTLIEHWDGKAWQVEPSPNPSSSFNWLTAVAATSSTDAWAVGFYRTPHQKTLVEHWNGKAWKIQPSPSPPGAALNGVAATSSTNAWTVGFHFIGGRRRVTLVEHWGGKAWKLQPSPSPGCRIVPPPNVLNGVAATSSTNAWAVGSTCGTPFSSGKTLVEHWNGKG